MDAKSKHALIKHVQKVKKTADFIVKTAVLLELVT